MTPRERDQAAPTHHVQPDMPTDNLPALVETAKEPGHAT